VLISLDQVPVQNPPRDVEIGELLTVVVVAAANVIKDIRENIRNLIGGRMNHYEKMIEEAVNQALQDLDHKAKERGYDGVIGVKITNPTVVEGAIEVIVYGNGFNYR
jgi:uncharacterized protein YbjQ (UPF0145 family)